MTPFAVMECTKDLSDMFQSLDLDYTRVSVYDLVIDFGTTFTKAGALRVWPLHKQRAQNRKGSPNSPLENIVIINGYRGRNGSKQLTNEVPTTWVYNGHNLVAWGVDLSEREDNDHITLDLVKLLLDESQRGAREKKKVQTKLDTIELKVGDVLTDYLRGLLRHAARQIDNIDPTKEKLIRVILCIPAIWKPLAQKTMREACQKALCSGMVLKDQEERRLITEPEAVAAFLMEKYPDLDVKDGDLIAILDCGGGTSDIALLHVVQRKPLQMNQAAPVNGEMLGSIFLDEAFEKRLRKRVSHLTSIPRSKLEYGIRKAVTQFKNHLKPDFEIGSGLELSVWFEGLPNDPDHGITSNRVWFTELEFRDIFDPLARGNVQLVVDIYNRYKEIMAREKTPVKELKCLFFVGGLAGSLYVEEAMREALFRDPILDHPVLVKTPSSDGATAIVRGALLLASNNSIIKDVRIPHGYAIVNDEPWRDRIHGRQVEKYKDKHEKRLMVRDRIKVLVQKEDVIQDSHKNSIIETSGALYFDWNPGQPCDVEINLWLCSERVDNHAELAELRATGVITLAYTLSFNLEDAIDARTEYERIPGEKGVRPVSERDKDGNAGLPRVTRSTARFQARELVAQNENTTESPQITSLAAASGEIPRSTLDFHDIVDMEQQSDLDTIVCMENTTDSLDPVQLTNAASPVRHDTFFRSTYQIVTRVVGSEMTFEVEAPPGGQIQQSVTLDIARN